MDNRLQKSKDFTEEYCCSVVRVGELTPVENSDRLMQERYKHLFGRFFRPQGERFKNIDCDIDYYICGIATESNYVMSDEVHLSLECRFIGHDYCGIPCDNRTLRGICICNRSFRFEPDEDIDAILAPMWVDKVKAIKEIDDAYSAILKNLLKVNKG